MERPLHIVYLCSEYPPAVHGGIGSFTQTLARALAAAGQRVTVVGFHSGGVPAHENDHGVHVIRIPHSRLPKSGFLLNGLHLRNRLRTLHRETPIDVIEGQENAFAIVPRRFPALKVIRMHGGHHFFQTTLGKEPAPWRGWIERRSFGNADRYCAVSRFVAETTRALLHLGERPIRVLPNPLPCDEFKPQPNISVDEDSILFVGTICDKKGVRQLIEAMPIVWASRPGAHLWLVGRDWPDSAGNSFTQVYRAMVPAAKREHVHFTGLLERKQLPAIIARMGVCVYPSHMEAMPLAWIEGMAMRKPVVASILGPGPEIIEDGVDGLLCNPRDPNSIASCLLRLLESADLRTRLAAAARSKVERLFSIEVLVKDNLAFYRQCVAERAPSALLLPMEAAW